MRMKKPSSGPKIGPVWDPVWAHYRPHNGPLLGPLRARIWDHIVVLFFGSYFVPIVPDESSVTDETVVNMVEDNIYFRNQNMIKIGCVRVLMLVFLFGPFHIFRGPERTLARPIMGPITGT